jgi:hypothetical protein
LSWGSVIFLFPLRSSSPLEAIYAKNIDRDEKLYRWRVEKDLQSSLHKKEDLNHQLGEFLRVVLLQEVQHYRTRCFSELMIYFFFLT